MGSIVSHIHDLLEEFGTWENYQLMLEKKKIQERLTGEAGRIQREVVSIKAIHDAGDHQLVYTRLIEIQKERIAALMERWKLLQDEIETGSSTWPSRRRPGYQEHELKTLPTYYQQAISGQKRFEYRRNDRCYHVGDVLILREYILPDLTDPGGYTGASCEFIINHVLDCSTIEPGSEFVVLQITPYS